jgi:hypothetical protein
LRQEWERPSNFDSDAYANASYQSRFDGGGFAYTGKAGLRVNW